MYKNAWGLRKLSDELNRNEDKELRRASRAAAGVEPLASQKFIDGVLWALAHPGVRRRNFASTAVELNVLGIWDAHGQPWTQFSIRAFVQRFLPY